MPIAIPPELKKITPYVRRAEELDKDKLNAESRLVAYYCRQYAVHAGIDLAKSAAGKTCLGDLLSLLEEEKVAMNSFTRDEAKFLCRKFAEKVFDKADLEDRTGGSTKITAKTFYAAASFLEILNQFYKNDEGSEELAEIKKRVVYAKWKATEILKALKEGRAPTPGGYGEDSALEEDEAGGESGLKVETVEKLDEDEKLDDGGPQEPDGPVVRLPSEDDNCDVEEESKMNKDEKEKEDEGTEVQLGPPPSYNFAPPHIAAPVATPPVVRPPLTFTPPLLPAPAMPPPSATKPVSPPPPVAKTEKKSGGGIFGGFGKKKKSNLSKAELADAVELTTFALAALEEKDSDLAAERLQQALKVLGR